MFLGRGLAIYEREISVFRNKGLSGVVKDIYTRSFRISRTLLFEHPGEGAGLSREKVPAMVTLGGGESLVINVISSADRQRFNNDIISAGGESDLCYFRLNGVCYLVRLNGRPVALGWSFSRNRMLKLLGIMDGVYFGGFHVNEKYRGLGVYTALLRRMCLDVPFGLSIIVETGLNNVASQRGLQRAGFKLVNKLTLVIAFGVRVYQHQSR